VGLDLGGGDYVTKPFSPRELAARVRTVLCRSAPTEAGSVCFAFGDIEIDTATREVRQAGRELRMTAKEFDLPSFLAGNPKRVGDRVDRRG
jgi:two-component system alkaline phosphatase synthesis response regulator PhoP